MPIKDDLVRTGGDVELEREPVQVDGELDDEIESKRDFKLSDSEYGSDYRDREGDSECTTIVE